jgi:hypothetical protein
MRSRRIISPVTAAIPINTKTDISIFLGKGAIYGTINLHFAQSIQKEKAAEKYLHDLVAKATGNHRILEEVRIYVCVWRQHE